MIQILFKILLIPIIAIIGIVVGLFCKGIDRILVARMQNRVGPPLVQPFLDVKKLLIKESIVPNRAVKWIFNLMPVIALSASIVILLYLPLGGIGPLLEGDGDVILVLYLFIIPALALVLGGFSSGSPYADIGSKREMIKLASYELPLAVVIISIVWLLSSINIENAFSLSVISGNSVWGLVGPIGFIGLSLLLLILLFVMPGEIGTVPFDVPTAGSEIAGGILAEYSGRNLALFYLAEAVKIVAVSSLIIALFLPWSLSGLLGISGFFGLLLDTLFFLVKLFTIVFVGSTFARVIAARLRIDQAIHAYWVQCFLVALCGLVLIGIDIVI